MDRFICLFFGNPKRMLWTFGGIMMLLAIFAPGAFHWFVGRAADETNWVLGHLFAKLWPWMKVAIFVAIAWAVITFVLPKSLKGGGKKDG